MAIDPRLNFGKLLVDIRPWFLQKSISSFLGCWSVLNCRCAGCRQKRRRCTPMVRFFAVVSLPYSQYSACSSSVPFMIRMALTISVFPFSGISKRVFFLSPRLCILCVPSRCAFVVSHPLLITEQSTVDCCVALWRPISSVSEINSYSTSLVLSGLFTLSHFLVPSCHSS